MDYRMMALCVKEASRRLPLLSIDERNAALSRIRKALLDEADTFCVANEADLQAAAELPQPIRDRLKFKEKKLADVTKGIEEVIGLPDPLGQELLKRELDTDLVLTKITCPIGVIGVIFESRPDALVQIAALCIKSGNGVILKGGSEAKNTNRALFDVIYKAGVEAGLPEDFAALVEERAGIDELIRYSDAIDLLIPRGSNAFVKYIMDHSEIPVMGHADGKCNIYVDASADPDLAIPLIIDAKTQYPSACNAAETLLLHKDIAGEILARLAVEAKDKMTLIPEEEADGFPEYLDTKITVKTVADPEEAISHINRYGSHHTDCIITKDPTVAERFCAMVDSAGVYVNASTRFADGFRYGFGAEVGISTGKLPPRGPVGLDGLVSYKYRLDGNGNLVGDYAEGKRSFHFRDLI